MTLAPPGAPPTASRPASVPRLPFWLRRPPSKRRPARPAPTPREPRWWLGVVWMVLAALALGFVAHVTLVGSLQHARAQVMLYDELRSSLAEAVAPLGQLDVDGVLVPDGTPVGRITIDSIGLDEVFAQGTTPDVLMGGPGHRRDTVMPGQEGTATIFGRQAAYGGPFSGLAGLAVGDEIEITTGQGTSTYEVFSIRREGDPLPETLAAGEGRLELVTGDGIPLAPTGALYVDADLTSEIFATPGRVFGTQALEPSERAMGAVVSDPIPVLFWLQCLILAAVALRWMRGRWGAWQTWIVAIPVLVALAAATAGATVALLPNLV